MNWRVRAQTTTFERWVFGNQILSRKCLGEKQRRKRKWRVGTEESEREREREMCETFDPGVSC